MQRLREAGIRFAVTSGRPPRGMAMLFDALKLDTPIAGFNGGLLIKPDLSIIEQRTVPADVAARSVELIRDHGLDAWVYRGNDWLVGNADGPHVAHEAWTVKFSPKVVTDVAAELDQVSKIVGVSDDLALVQRCEADVRAAFGERATANRSQPYYLDVTNKDANKGAVVELCRGTSECRPRRSPPSATNLPMYPCSSAPASASPWAILPTRSRSSPPSPLIPTMTKASPRRWSVSSSARWIEVGHGDEGRIATIPYRQAPPRHTADWMMPVALALESAFRPSFSASRACEFMEGSADAGCDQP